MDYELTNDQKELQQDMARFCKEEIAPKAKVLDESPSDKIGAIIKENLKKLAKVNYLGLGIEVRYGGSDLDLVSQCIAGEEVAKACASTFLSAWSSAYMFGAMLNLFGADEQKGRYLPGVVKADVIGALAYTEPDAGVDIAGIKTIAEKKGDKWVINGTKDLVTNAPIADVFLVLAYTNTDAESGSGMTVFIIDKDTKGISVGKPIETMGLRGAPIAGINIDNCEVSDDSILGGETGKGLSQIERIFENGKIGMATMAVGIGMACTEGATQYAKDRKAFGRQIGKFQEVGFKLADMFTYNDLGRMLTYRAAWGFDKGEKEANILASCAKLFAGEAITNIANWSLHVFAGHGYLKGTDVERLYRDARFCEIGYGTSEMQRSIISKDALDKFAS
ncbi:MAG: acyl-CoA dehydrogenase family protein [Thermodesulfobacteriota bacterium]|nr:acyl-CoA dehydrogenase family protein [Thermodesulfobacteriota bacterium]